MVQSFVVDFVEHITSVPTGTHPACFQAEWCKREHTAFFTKDKKDQQPTRDQLVSNTKSKNHNKMQKQIKARCRKQVLVATTLTSSLFVVRSSTSNQHLPALHHPASQQLHRWGSTGSALSQISAPKVKIRTLNMQLMFPYILPQIIFLQPCSCMTKPNNL